MVAPPRQGVEGREPPLTRAELSDLKHIPARGALTGRRKATYTPATQRGGVAQLGERYNRTVEVGGSSPPASTTREMIRPFRGRIVSFNRDARATQHLLGHAPRQSAGCGLS